MSYYPPLKEVNTKRLVTDTFSGYNHNLKVGDGEFYDTMNLSTQNFPLFENRQKRGLLRHMSSPGGMLAKEKLAFVDDGKLYYDNRVVYEGLTDGEKQIVSFGAYIIVLWLLHLWWRTSSVRGLWMRRGKKKKPQNRYYHSVATTLNKAIWNSALFYIKTASFFTIRQHLRTNTAGKS